MNIIEANLSAGTANFVIIASRFNQFIVDQLVNGAVTALKQHMVTDEHITLVRVPGAYEIPLVALRLAQGKKYHAIIALGAVIRGATAHFDFVAGECNKGLSQVSMQWGIPIANGVLTVENIEQAIERAGTKSGNKGADAAITALEMVQLLGMLG